MRFTRITTVLQVLDKPELKRLEDYLHSPYFKVSPEAVQLFGYLKKLPAAYNEQAVSEEKIAKAIAHLNSRNKQDIAGARLFKAIEHFLVLEDLEKNKMQQTQHLLKAYKERHLFEFFEREYKQAMEQLDQDPEQDIDTFYYRHVFTEQSLNGFDAVMNRTSQNDINPILKSLDEFYALKKLRYACESLNRQRVLGTFFEEANNDFLLQILKPYNNEKYLYVYLFINVYQLLKAKTFDEGEKYYLPLGNFIEQNTTTTLPQGVKEAVTYALSHSQTWSNSGYKKAGMQSLQLLELQIKYGLLLTGSKLEPSKFRNIVGLAINNRKSRTWIKQFIDAFSNYLPKEDKEINCAFVLAQYNYYIKNYDEAMPLFQQAQVKNEPILAAIVRRWQFMCMYEQNPYNTDILLAFLDTYEKFIQRNAEELHRTKHVFTKNISYSRKLLKATDAGLQQQVTKALQAEEYFVGKDWLLQQLEVKQQMAFTN